MWLRLTAGDNTLESDALSDTETEIPLIGTLQVTSSVKDGLSSRRSGFVAKKQNVLWFVSSS